MEMIYSVRATKSALRSSQRLCGAQMGGIDFPALQGRKAVRHRDREAYEEKNSIGPPETEQRKLNGGRH